MNAILDKWLKDKDFKKWFKKENLIVLILVGALLVIIALPTKGDEGSESGSDKQAGVQNPTVVSAEDDAAEAAAYSDDEYARQLEQRLEDILSGMEGVGQVNVMITLKSSTEQIVEKEQPYLRSSTTESDSQGGNRLVSQTEMEENTVYKTDGSISEPYVIKTLPPKIEGVVVVAQGAGTGTVNRIIVETVQALFGVEAHKVKVVKMEVAK